MPQNSLVTRQHFHEVAASIADLHGGVAKRTDLLAAGITTDLIRAQIAAGRWHRLGVHTIGITAERSVTGQCWRAVWESGTGAVIDGVTALHAAGLIGWTEDVIHISVPGNSRVHRQPGVVIHRPRDVRAIHTTGIPRVQTEVAVIRAAQWARSDRAAATLLAMTVQQRLAHPDRVLHVWRGVRRSPRRAFLEAVISDVCRGAQSLGELDFALLCRARGLPEPTRQAVRRGPRGRVYLDVLWADIGLHVEIDGAQHTRGLAPVEDALRQNHLAIDGQMTLRVPVLGLRLQPNAFMDQVVAAHTAASRRARRSA